MSSLLTLKNILLHDLLVPFSSSLLLPTSIKTNPIGFRTAKETGARKGQINKNANKMLPSTRKKNEMARNADEVTSLSMKEIQENKSWETVKFIEMNKFDSLNLKK